MKCGFKIGGGIDQDYRKSPQGYTDNVSIHFSKLLSDQCYYNMNMNGSYHTYSDMKLS